jgi:hypothetical protein
MDCRWGCIGCIACTAGVAVAVVADVCMDVAGVAVAVFIVALVPYPGAVADAGATAAGRIFIIAIVGSSSEPLRAVANSVFRVSLSLVGSTSVPMDRSPDMFFMLGMPVERFPAMVKCAVASMWL